MAIRPAFWIVLTLTVIACAIVVHQWLTSPDTDAAAQTESTRAAPVATAPVIEAPRATVDVSSERAGAQTPAESAPDPDRPSEQELHSRGDDGQHAE